MVLQAASRCPMGYCLQHRVCTFLGASSSWPPTASNNAGSSSRALRVAPINRCQIALLSAYWPVCRSHISEETATHGGPSRKGPSNPRQSWDSRAYSLWGSPGANGSSVSVKTEPRNYIPFGSGRQLMFDTVAVPGELHKVDREALLGELPQSLTKLESGVGQ